jgi:hypothetical protein
MHQAMKALCSVLAIGLALYVACSVFADDKRTTRDLVTPEMTTDDPAAGRRVRQVAPEYEGTEVYHALYLPVDWKPGDKYSLIIEYTGNRFAESGSTGEVKDANLGYGLTGGKGFIWVSMPRICEQFGGDLESVFICGFSRGAIGASYIGLADDEIASFWKGMITHDHFDGDRRWGYPESDRKSALLRLARLKGRPVLVCGQANDFLHDHLALAKFTFLKPPVAEIFEIPEGKVIHPHTDLWMHRDSKYREQARQWLHQHK